MHKRFFAVTTICLTQYGTAQQAETVSFLNNSGESVIEKKGSFLIQKLRINDSLWEMNAYSLYGPRITSVQSKDEKGTIRNGRYISYSLGRADTVGYFVNNQPEGTWYVYAVNHRVAKQLEFSMGTLVSVEDSSKINQKRASRDSADLPLSQTMTGVEAESSFNGGQRAWGAYLIKHMRYPERAVSYEVKGEVIVQFVVDQLGKIQDPFILQSVEYSLDQESLRMIRESPDWIPAEFNGRKVKSYQKQPFRFRMQ